MILKINTEFFPNSPKPLLFIIGKNNNNNNFGLYTTKSKIIVLYVVYKLKSFAEFSWSDFRLVSCSVCYL
jgi:hypothetical protein